MIKKRPHIIKSQCIELEYDKSDQAKALYTEVADLCKNSLDQKLNSLLDEFDVSGKVWCLNTIAIDLGMMSRSQIAVEMPDRIVKALRKKLFEKRNLSGDHASQTNEIHKACFQAITLFLKQGYLNWNAKQDLLHQANLVLKENPNGLISFLKEEGRSLHILKRLTDRFPAAFLRKVILAMEPSNGTYIIDYQKHLIRLNTQEVIVSTANSTVEKAVWRFIFNYLLLEKESLFNTKNFTKSILHQFSCHFNIRYIDLVTLLLTGLKKMKGVPDSLFVIISEIGDELNSDIAKNYINNPTTKTDTSNKLFQIWPHLESRLNDTLHGKTLVPELLSWTANSNNKIIISWLRKIKNKNTILEKLVAHDHTKFPKRVIRALEPAGSQSIFHFHQNWIALHQISPIGHISKQDLEDNMWVMIITILLDTQGSYFNRKTFLKSLIRSMSQRHHISETALLRKIIQAANSIPSHTASLTSFFKLIKEIEVEEAPPIKHQGTAQELKTNANEKSLIEILSLWETRPYSSTQNQEKKFLRALSLTSKSATYLKKHIGNPNIYNSIATFSESGFQEVTQILCPAPQISWITAWIQFFLHQEKHLAALFGGRGQLKQALRLAFLQTIGVLMRRNVSDKAQLHSLFLDTLAVYGKVSKAKKTLYKISGKEKPSLSEPKKKSFDAPKEELFYWITTLPRNEADAIFYGFDSLEHALKFSCIHHPKEFYHFLKRLPRQKIRSFLAALTIDELYLLNPLIKQSTASWIYSLFQSWIHFLDEFKNSKNTIADLYQLAWREMLSFRTTSQLISELMKILKKNNVPDTFYKKISQWSLPAYGNVSTAIAQIENLVQEIGNNKTEYLDLGQKTKIIEQVVDDTKAHSLSKAKEDNTQDDEIYIRNAGLVLIHPYLTYLLEQCNLVSNGEFISSHAVTRAVSLLHYIASGLEHSCEEDLMLNKLMCGLKPASVIDPTTLTKNEKKIARALMHAFSEHWNVIEKSTDDEIRGNWFVREGRLRETENYWELIVERKAYDLLLESLPFSISPMTFPWMNKMMTIQWL